MIQERTNHSTLLGTLYYRVSLINTHKVNHFWIKELIFIIVLYFKNFRFEKAYFTKEMRRNLSNFFLLLKMRRNYDELVNKVLSFKLKSMH